MLYSEEKICSRCVLNSTFPDISFNDEGICSVCTDYDLRFSKWEEQRKALPRKRKAIEQICKDAKSKKREFDVLVPLSGGKDSMYVLYLAVKELGLKPLAYTMDNGYLSETARRNIDKACNLLGVEHIYYCMNPQLMNKLFKLFVEKTGYFCSICMRAIEMTTERVADLYDIPLVFAGSASNVELPTSPKMFQQGSRSFVKNVLKGEEIFEESRILLYKGRLKRRLGYQMFWWGSQKRLGTYAWINLPDYIEWNYETMFKIIRDELGWESPSGNDEEHIDCDLHKASSYIHNRRWKGSEIPRLTLAGLIMAGQAERKNALEALDKKQDFLKDDENGLEILLNGIEMDRVDFDRYIDQGPRYLDYRDQLSLVYLILRGIKRRLFNFLGLKKYIANS